jgi:hypothetical protein
MSANYKIIHVERKGAACTSLPNCTFYCFTTLLFSILQYLNQFMFSCFLIRNLILLKWGWISAIGGDRMHSRSAKHYRFNLFLNGFAFLTLFE